MSQEREQEIRRQFLDEAQEYLGLLESAVLGVADNRVEAQKINEALRAAHSIKGGAGMMGFDVLSMLAHQLEDSFKVLKIQKSLTISSDLEQLLLGAVSCLRDVIECDRANRAVTPDWLETQAGPIFDQLHQQLGDPQEEDVTSMMGPEDGQNIVVLLFETEVEGCLQRLEGILADPAMPCLSEELIILTQELGGLGEMLQLPAFTQLCNSVAQAVEVAPEEIVAISQESIQAWRHTQALILTGQMDLLPTSINHPAANAIPAASGVGVVELPSINHDMELAIARETETIAKIEDFVAKNEIKDEISEISIPSAIAATQEFPQDIEIDDNISVFKVESEAEPIALGEDENVTVRVSVRQLNQLNDLLSELTIGRNTLDSYLKRLKGLAQMLNRRVEALKQTSNELQTAYNKTTSQPLDFPILELSGTGNSNVSFPPSSVSFFQPDVNFQTSNFDTLELDRYDDFHLSFQQVMETIVQTQEVASDIDLSLEDTEQNVRELNKTSRHLQTNLTHLRMRPLSDITDRFPRAIREMSLQFGKSVELTVVGKNTLIDRSILEALNDPLLHLVRNAFDHGIENVETRKQRNKPEKGLIEITAKHQGNRTIITIRDDGGGIPLDKVRRRAEQMGFDAVLLAEASDEELISLIFEPGFSTTDQVTSLSGRGVGMDVVRDRLKQIRGEIKVDTQLGQGTTFTLSVPYTLSIVRVLLVEVYNMLLAIPADVVVEMTLLKPDQILTTERGEQLNWQGTPIKLVRLAHWLQFNYPRHAQTLEMQPLINADAALVVKYGNRSVALHIDRCWNEQEVAVRRIEGKLTMPPGFTNCTILGDGRVVPLVNISELLRWVISREQQAASTGTNPLSSAPVPLNPLPPKDIVPDSSVSSKNTILIVDDSINVRRFLALTLERGGYQVIQAQDGQDALEKLQKGAQVQAIICDIEMPRLDGFGFLAKFKADQRLPELPIVMLTSRSNQKHQQLARNLGAAAYFSKPYNEQSLLRTIQQLIDSSMCVANV
jgi:chemosensory pili system protein ChpA (sensor histidine kinase/response regulator)